MLRKLFNVLLFLGVLLFGALNFVCYQHAYQLTHYTLPVRAHNKIVKPDLQKMTQEVQFNRAVWSVARHKPGNWQTPKTAYQNFNFSLKPKLNAWFCKAKTAKAKGIFLIFHGYNSCKANMINRSEVLQMMGYHTFLVDFRGHGDSETNKTTIGIKEAEDVLQSYHYIRGYYPEEKISILGISMGAAAAVKAIAEDSLKLEYLLLEAPYGSLKEAIKIRLNNMGVSVPGLEYLLLFWGSCIHQMNAFDQDIAYYAKKIKTPTLLLRGAIDKKVAPQEIQAIHKAIRGQSQIVELPNAGHDNTFEDNPNAWKSAVSNFLD